MFIQKKDDRLLYESVEWNYVQTQEVLGNKQEADRVWKIWLKDPKGGWRG